MRCRGRGWLAVESISSVGQDQRQDVEVEESHILVFPPLDTWKGLVGQVKVSSRGLPMPTMRDNHVAWESGSIHAS